MIEGIVIGVTRRSSEGNVAHLHVEHGAEIDQGTADIRVVEAGGRVILGDAVRWDPKKAVVLWQPSGRSGGEVRLRRLKTTPRNT